MYLESSMQSMSVEEREEAFTDVARLSIAPRSRR